MEDITAYILKRYLDENNNETTWKDIVDRISVIYPPIREYILSMKFIPGGRTLAALNTPNKPMIPNCVTIDLEDDLADIFVTLTRLMELTRRGSGVGMNFGKMRPAGCLCKRYNAKSSGPVGFLYMFSVVMKTIQQQSRHGAFMGILPITHPDILSFIHVKQNLKLINNFNLSVLITEDFLNRLFITPNENVVSNYTYTHSDGSIDKVSTINYITYDDSFVVQDVTPIDITYQELFDEVIKCAWTTGEPGFLFEKNMNANNPLINILGKMVTTNPCGEQVMYENECCNLGSLNLSEFCDDLQFDPFVEYKDDIVKNIYKKHIHVSNLIRCSREAIIYLNSVIDYIKIDDEKIDKMMKSTRRIGLGVMGLHDMLIKLKLPYDSEEGREIVKCVMDDIKNTAELTSNDLINKFGNISDRMLKNGIIKTPFETNKANITLMTVAPNGSTSMIPNVSSGIEPYYSLGYYRLLDNAKNKSKLVVNKQLQHWINMNIPEDDREHVLNTIINKGITNCSDIPEYIKNVFKTAQDIKPEDHVSMQAAVQEFVDNSISKTINLPEDATLMNVKSVVLMAERLKIKGLTVYRDNCRQNVITSSLSKDSCKDGTCDI